MTLEFKCLAKRTSAVSRTYWVDPLLALTTTQLSIKFHFLTSQWPQWVWISPGKKSLRNLYRSKFTNNNTFNTYGYRIHCHYKDFERESEPKNRLVAGSVMYSQHALSAGILIFDSHPFGTHGIRCRAYLPVTRLLQLEYLMFSCLSYFSEAHLFWTYQVEVILLPSMNTGDASQQRLM